MHSLQRDGGKRECREEKAEAKSKTRSQYTVVTYSAIMCSYTSQIESIAGVHGASTIASSDMFSGA